MDSMKRSGKRAKGKTGSSQFALPLLPLYSQVPLYSQAYLIHFRISGSVGRLPYMRIPTR
jgi:hypothetical protein